MKEGNFLSWERMNTFLTENLDFAGQGVEKEE